MRIKSLLAVVLLATCFATAGCSLPVSDFPLTDEKTSTLDERLIGYWTYVPEKDDPGAPAPYTVGRMKDKPNALEMIWVELDGDGHAKVNRAPLYCAKIGEERYLSIPMQEEEIDGLKAARYTIARYELGDDNTGLLYFMSSDEIAGAVEGGKLKGVVRRSKRATGADPNEKTNYEELRVTAEPKELAAFIKAKGKTCFVDEPMAFKRKRNE